MEETHKVKGALILCFILFELLLFVCAWDYFLTEKHNELVVKYNDQKINCTKGVIIPMEDRIFDIDWGGEDVEGS